MEQLLKVGTVVQGQRGRYRIEELLRPSAVSVAYRCQAENGDRFRLRHYQSGCPMLGEARERFLALPPMTGILPLKDHGEALGLAFDVFPEAGEALSARNVGLPELIRFLIPQLNYGIAQMHRRGLVIRKISPETIRYDSVSHRGWLTGFDNLAPIYQGATATRAACKGLPAPCYPPEYRDMGWSVYSDYYALGMTLFQCVRGAQGLEQMQPGQIWSLVQSGRLPGLDRALLTQTPYTVLSAEQKLLYLVLGLTLPDPHQRWGFGEVRSWCAGQALPLVQTGERVRYQMSVPFPVEGKRCWDYPQLALALAGSGRKAEGLLPALVKHISAQNRELAGRLQQILAQKELSPPGKLFYTVYTIAPAMSGFWWRGTCYQTSAELARASRTQRESLEFLGQMLRDRCFSFLTRLRGVKTEAQRQELTRFQQLETWEREETGKGAARFLMQMAGAGGQRFQAEGKSYSSLEELLADYAGKGHALRQVSGAILRDGVFQSWMWAKGFAEPAQTAARQATKPEDAFYALLMLCERMSGEKGKRVSRRMYLRWGPCAQVTWLKNHLHWYESEEGAEVGIIRRMQNARWTEEVPLEELRRSETNLLMEYQNFVRNTETNPLKRVSGVPAGEKMLIQPTRAEAFFCCQWEQSEVTPDFLRWIRAAVSLADITQWCDEKYTQVEGWIRQEEQAVQAIPGFSRDGSAAAGTYGTGGVVLWFLLIAAQVACAVFLYGFHLLTPICAVIALWFPVMALTWSRTRQKKQELRQTELNHLRQRLDELAARRETANRVRETLAQEVTFGKGVALQKETPLHSLTDTQQIAAVSDRMEGGRFRFSLMVSNAALLLMGVAATGSLPLCVGAVVYSVIATYLRSELMLSANDAIGPLLFVQITGWILAALFLQWPVVSVIGAVVLLYMSKK